MPIPTLLPPPPDRQSIVELRSLSDEELIRRHDAHTRANPMTADDYRNELFRRVQARQGDRVERLTWIVMFLTAFVTSATIVQVIVALMHS